MAERAVENANKRIRRFMPGDTDLASISQRDLNTPCPASQRSTAKMLGYKTPAEVFIAHLRGSG
jgi:IS30 family transposase